MARAAKRRGPPDDDEKAYIRANSIGSNSMTDQQIADKLGGSIYWVRKWRKKLGIKKTGTADLTPEQEKTIKEARIKASGAAKINMSDPSTVNELDVRGMQLSDMRNLFEELFQNSMQYKQLEKSYSEEELKYYLEEFGAFVTEVKGQGENLTQSEFRNLDNLIQLNIRRNRLIAEEKEVRDTVQRILDNEGVDGIEALDGEKRATVYQLKQEIKDHPRWLKDINDQTIKVQEGLNMIRSKRIEMMKDSQKGILRVVQQFMNKDKKDDLDKQGSMLEAAKNKVEKKWKNEGWIVTGENDEDV